MPKINVLIADGSKLLREGLAALLQKHADLRVVGEAADAHSAGKLIDPLGVDILIMNLSAATSMSAQLLRSLVADHPTIRIVALALHPGPRDVQMIVDAGAMACLTKECASEDLVAAIRSVVAGKRFLSPRLTEVILSGYASPTAKAPITRPLAPREQEILRRIASGQATKQIAFELRVGTKTIETHRRRIMAKLNRHSVAELTQYAMLEGLVQLEARSDTAKIPS
jgi:DNA-binding NarL/FixJ family response regulator